MGTVTGVRSFWVKYTAEAVGAFNLRLARIRNRNHTATIKVPSRQAMDKSRVVRTMIGVP